MSISSEQVEALWPLSQTFEYAAEIGSAIKASKPEWWNIFALSHELEMIPSGQAQGFAFLEYLEDQEEIISVDQLIVAIGAALAACAPRVREEWKASLDCIDRDYSDREDTDEIISIQGMPVVLYKPHSCENYPTKELAVIDEWTKQALEPAQKEYVLSKPAEIDELKKVHSASFVEDILRFSSMGGGMMTPETIVLPSSKSAVLAASGALITASREVLRSRDKTLRLCQVHPGSHHAEIQRAGGTNLINNLAVAAKQALLFRAKKVAILDVDAHHGQGTESIFYQSDKVLVASIHQAGPFFPGTGDSRDIGLGKGKGFNRNFPVEDRDEWNKAVHDSIISIKRFRPSLLLMEFSTDAHRSDGVSDLDVRDEDYFALGKLVRSCNVPVVCELGASLSKRAWIGGLSAFIAGYND